MENKKMFETTTQIAYDMCTVAYCTIIFIHLVPNQLSYGCGPDGIASPRTSSHIGGSSGSGGSHVMIVWLTGVQNWAFPQLSIHGQW